MAASGKHFLTYTTTLILSPAEPTIRVTRPPEFDVRLNRRCMVLRRVSGLMPVGGGWWRGCDPCAPQRKINKGLDNDNRDLADFCTPLLRTRAMYRRPGRINRDGDRHVFDLKFVNSFHAEVFERN